MADIQTILDQEIARFAAAHPQSAALYEAAKPLWRDGVPMHWMKDWASPYPIYVARAKDATLWDVDGCAFDDFCLGDTPSMFGHGRAELAQAVATQMGEGVGFMLPSPTSNDVGGLLAARFGLPFWQVATTASDANRSVIRWARAITQRPKILIFDGCYHGMVDDCFVVLERTPKSVERFSEEGAREHHAVMKDGLIGQVYDMTQNTVVVPFNDLNALTEALKGQDVAAILMEPVMTNCGMIAPDDGYLSALEAAAKATGTLVIYDETHTLSSSHEGYVKAHGLNADILVIGKAIAGGIPAAVWGVTADVAARMDAAQARIGAGSSGIGTTLSGNALVMTAIKTMLTEIITPEAYQHMLSGAQRLVSGLKSVIAAHDLPWSVAHVGARAELIFAPDLPKSAAQMCRHLSGPLLDLYHLYLINEGVLIAPFHNMMLISPKTSEAAIDRLIAATDRFATLVKS